VNFEASDFATRSHTHTTPCTTLAMQAPGRCSSRSLQSAVAHAVIDRVALRSCVLHRFPNINDLR